MCVDCCLLNAKARQDAYQLPRIDESIYASVGAKYFLTMDIASVHNHVEANPADPVRILARFMPGTHQDFGHQEFCFPARILVRLAVGSCRVHTLLSSSNSMTFSMTFSSFPIPWFSCLFQKFKNFHYFRVFFDLKQFNRQELWHPHVTCHMSCKLGFPSIVSTMCFTSWPCCWP